MKKQNSLHTIRDVSVALNNMMAVVLHPESGEIKEPRLKRLREFSQALIAPLEELVNGGRDEQGEFGPCLKPEELVAVLIAAALYVHLSSVSQTERLPNKDISDLLFDKTYVDKQ